MIASAALLAAAVLAADHAVVVSPSGGYNYSPASLSIAVGDTVTWSFASLSHSVTQSPDTGCLPLPSGFNSGNQVSPSTFTQAFSTAGTIYYYCQVSSHCSSGMKGVITVGGGANSTSTSTPDTATPTGKSAATTAFFSAGVAALVFLALF